MLSKATTHPVVTHALAGASVTLKTKDAIADSGATQIFIMENTLVVNKCATQSPLKVALADGRIVYSTHKCNVHIVGLPTILTGHIILELSIALLFGIKVLIEAGCKVHFNKHACTVWYDNKIILDGGKDETTDLWILPVRTPNLSNCIAPPLASTSDSAYAHCATTLPVGMSNPLNCIAPPAASTCNIAHAHCTITQIAFFMHTVCNRANSIQFSHQALCSPRIFTLVLKTIQRSFLKGCPNLLAKGVVKYLNPSPASAKGHMKHQCQGIESTRRGNVISSPDAGLPPPHACIENNIAQDNFDYELDQQHIITTGANIITDNNSLTGANLFCFANFGEEHTGTLYNDLTGSFPFMSLQGNVCSLVVYHYETNVILALPISGFSDEVIFDAYKQQ
jgi:hypothetical protein